MPTSTSSCHLILYLLIITTPYLLRASICIHTCPMVPADRDPRPTAHDHELLSRLAASTPARAQAPWRHADIQTPPPPPVGYLVMGPLSSRMNVHLSVLLLRSIVTTHHLQNLMTCRMRPFLQFHFPPLPRPENACLVEALCSYLGPSKFLFSVNHGGPTTSSGLSTTYERPMLRWKCIDALVWSRWLISFPRRGHRLSHLIRQGCSCKAHVFSSNMSLTVSMSATCAAASLH